jgi:hypothetical protein
MNACPSRCLLLSWRVRVIGFVVVAWALPTVAAAQSLAWTRQLGTSANEQLKGVAVDGFGNVVAVGETGGTIFAPNVGFTDAIAARYNSGGTLLGGLQDGTVNGDDFHAASADGAGGVYVAGYTQGPGASLGSPSNTTGNNIIGRIDFNSTYNWLQQESLRDPFGGGGGYSPYNFVTAGTAFGVVAGPHIGGGDVLVNVYDNTGAILWDDQTGTTAHEGSFAATGDPFGNYYVVGRTEGNWGGPQGGFGDAFVVKYDSAGVQQWVRQLGSAGNDSATSVTTDFIGNVYMAGITDGSLGGPNQGSSDNFVAMYDPAGNFQWVKQIATSGLEGNPTVVGLGLSVWVGGTTSGSLYGLNQGQWDVYVAQLDTLGNIMYSTQLGTPQFDQVVASAAEFGAVYFAGTSNGNFAGPLSHQGGDDGILIAFSAIPPIPEPSGLALIACAAAALAARSRRRR